MPKYPEVRYGPRNVIYAQNQDHQPQIYGDLPISTIDTGEYSSGRTGYQIYADVFIDLFENGQPVDGNYGTITYREGFNNIISDPKSVTIIGTYVQIGYQTLLQDTDVYNPQYYTLYIEGYTEPDGGYTAPGVCDIKISTVVTDKKESGAGRADGQVTVKATSSAGGIQYSINNLNWQSDATFSNLAGGGYTAYAKDAAGCTAQQNLTVDKVSNLLIDDPSVDVGSGNMSRWSAAFNPVVFSYQRRDFGVIDIQAANLGYQTSFKINGALNSGSVYIAVNDKIYVNAGPYNGVYSITHFNYNTSEIWVNAPYQESAEKTGFVNINKLRPYYEVETQITYQDKLTGLIDTIKCVHRPNNSGLTRADVSSFLQSLLRAKDDADLSQPNARDYNLGASYTIKYTEGWQNPDTGNKIQMPTVNVDTPHYVTYSARQLGDAYGGNMAAYVPFKTVDAPSKRARWLCDFAEPAYSPGYPFDIGFIYGDDLAGLNLYTEITPLDINRNVLGLPATTYLLNEDGSFLLQQDNSKLVIIRPPVTNEPITTGLAQHVGVNRLRINTDFDSRACYFKLDLKYRDGAGEEHSVMQTQVIRIDDAIDEQSVYLRWIGLNGSWNYYRFVYNQEVSLDVQNAVIIKKHITDWATQDGIDDVISKNAGLKMKVMAEDLSVADIKGLQSIKYSPKVQMLVDKNPVGWQTVVLNTATFAEYETRNRQAPFSVTFNLPALNVQTQ